MQSSARFMRSSGITAMLGGALWLPYGVLEMLEPWGAATAPYREDVGYEVVTDAFLHVVYGLPGSLALLLTSLCLLGAFGLLALPAVLLGRVARSLIHVAVVLAVVSLVGVVMLFDPLFTAGRIFGTLALGVAACLAGIDLWRAGGMSGWAFALVLLGLIGMFLLPLWPLVYAAEWLSQSTGAAIIAVFGSAWVAFGWALRSGKAATPGTPARRA